MDDWDLLRRLRLENGPRAIEENVGCELLLALILSYSSSVDSDHITHSLGYWQVLEPVSEQNKGAVADPAISLVDGATLVGDLHGAHIFV